MDSKEKLWEIYRGITHEVDKQICAGQIGTFQEVILRVKDAPAVDAVVLPCKVGDTVWGIRNYKGVNHPQQGKVDQMYYTNDMRLHIKIKHICIGEWGKKIFPTREEAEAALKRRGEHERD